MRDFNPTTKSFNSSIMRFNNEIMTLCIETISKRKEKFNRMQGGPECYNRLYETSTRKI